MALLPLCAENLHLLDHGRAGIALDEALKIVLRDLDERGKDYKARKITLTLELGLIEKTEQGYCDIRVDHKLPTLDTSSTIGVLHLQPNGTCLFNFHPHSPGNPAQGTIFDQQQQSDPHKPTE